MAIDRDCILSGRVGVIASGADGAWEMVAKFEVQKGVIQFGVRQD